MAASIKTDGWRQALGHHPVSKYLKKTKCNSAFRKDETEAKNIISIHGSDLFIWDFSDSAILHCNLRSVDEFQSSQPQVESVAKFSNLQISNGQGKDQAYYQKFILSDSYGFDVEEIIVNKCSSHILAWGQHGIRVVALPRRWGSGAIFEGGKNVINCRTVVIGERDFHANHSLTVRQARWHPGSQTCSHVALLTSDNVFSVYNISEPSQPISTIHIDMTDASLSAVSPGKSFVSSALGESSVAFDFGSPIQFTPKERHFGKNALIPSIEVWPVYCVKGNGDVMLLYSHLSNYSSLRLPVHGPLSMYPPAEDNYGVDACSILCLNVPMPVLAISTCDGRLHHCVQLNDTEEYDDDQIKTSSSPGYALYDPIPEPTLYVIESVELELCLQTKSTLEPGVDDGFVMCPVQLQHDVNSSDRYYCVHTFGVHSVALPWLSVVLQYFLDKSGDIAMTKEKEGVVEHLFCSKPLSSCPASPVLGVDVISDPVLGPTLIILSNDYDFTSFPIGLQYRINSTFLGLESKNDNFTSTSRSSQLQPFSQHIKEILHRQISNPLMRSNKQSEPCQQECFQLLSRATQILREEYIEKQDHAREEIDTRIAILRDLKDQQLQEIKRLKDTSKILREQAGNVAERLNTFSDNYQILRERLNEILHKLQGRVPHMSEAERNLTRELRAIQSCLQGYQNNLDAVKTKMEYQERQMKKTTSVSSPVLQEKQLNRIKNVLKEEANEIEDLKKDIELISKDMS